MLHVLRPKKNNNNNNIYLSESKLLIYKYGKNEARPHEKEIPKRILVLIIRSANNPMAPYIPNNSEGAPQKN